MWEINKQRYNKSYGFWYEATVIAAREAAPQFDMVAEIGDRRFFPNGKEGFELLLSGGPVDLSLFWEVVHDYILEHDENA